MSMAWLYSESVDSASPQSAELNAPAISSVTGELERKLKELFAGLKSMNSGGKRVPIPLVSA
jgi:hypothetical protein